MFLLDFFLIYHKHAMDCFSMYFVQVTSNKVTKNTISNRFFSKYFVMFRHKIG